MSNTTAMDVDSVHAMTSRGPLMATVAGPADGPLMVFLHGWPQDRTAWSQVLGRASVTHRCIAFDLPGIAGSTPGLCEGRKNVLAALVREALLDLGVMAPVVIVGHDIGGMIGYAYLRQHEADVAGLVLADTVVPGIPPWSAVVANPKLWHFAFHATPRLPERLVGQDIRTYFDYFFDAVAASPESIPERVRRHFVDSYRTSAALAQGFEFYRAFDDDAAFNARHAADCTVPVLYLRGAQGDRPLTPYVDGLSEAGLQVVNSSAIAGSGHYTPQERPDRFWSTVEDWLTSQRLFPRTTP